MPLVSLALHNGTHTYRANHTYNICSINCYIIIIYNKHDTNADNIYFHITCFYVTYFHIAYLHITYFPHYIFSYYTWTLMYAWPLWISLLDNYNDILFCWLVQLCLSYMHAAILAQIQCFLLIFQTYIHSHLRTLWAAHHFALSSLGNSSLVHGKVHWMCHSRLTLIQPIMVFAYFALQGETKPNLLHDSVNEFTTKSDVSVFATPLR